MAASAHSDLGGNQWERDVNFCARNACIEPNSLNRLFMHTSVASVGFNLSQESRTHALERQTITDRLDLMQELLHDNMICHPGPEHVSTFLDL